MDNNQRSVTPSLEERSFAHLAAAFERGEASPHSALELVQFTDDILPASMGKPRVAVTAKTPNEAFAKLAELAVRQQGQGANTVCDPKVSGGCGEDWTISGVPCFVKNPD